MRRRLAKLRWSDLCLSGLFSGGLSFLTDRPYLLDVPIVKFFLSQTLDVVLTINLTFPLIPAFAHFGARELLYAKVRCRGCARRSRAASRASR